MNIYQYKKKDDCGLFSLVKTPLIKTRRDISGFVEFTRNTGAMICSSRHFQVFSIAIIE